MDTCVHAVSPRAHVNAPGTARARRTRLIQYIQRTGLAAYDAPPCLLRRESSIWQRRFWEHQIRDENDFERHMDYIHFNPVKHGYVHQVSEWPHSTFHRHVRDGIYPVDWGGAPGIDGLDFE